MLNTKPLHADCREFPEEPLPWQVSCDLRQDPDEDRVVLVAHATTPETAEALFHQMLEDWQIGRFICRSGEGILPFEIQDFDFGYDARDQVFAFTDVMDGEEATATIYVFETEEPTDENDYPAADERLLDDLACHCTYWNTGRACRMFGEE